MEIVIEDLSLEELIVVYPGMKSFELGEGIRVESLVSAMARLEGLTSH